MGSGLRVGDGLIRSFIMGLYKRFSTLCSLPPRLATKDAATFRFTLAFMHDKVSESKDAAAIRFILREISCHIHSCIGVYAQPRIS